LPPWWNRPRIQTTPGGPIVPLAPPPPPPDNQNNLPNKGLTGCPCPETFA
jgi:hypothetical protein